MICYTTLQRSHRSDSHASVYSRSGSVERRRFEIAIITKNALVLMLEVLAQIGTAHLGPDSKLFS